MTTTPTSPVSTAPRLEDGAAQRGEAKPAFPHEVRALAERGATDRGAIARDARRSAFRSALRESGSSKPDDGGSGAAPPRVARDTVRSPASTLDDGELRARRPKPLGERRSDDTETGLEAFRPPSAILAPPPGTAAATRAAPSGFDRAEAAALAERLVLGLRVGRVGRDGHVVQLRLRAPSGGDIDVRLRHQEGRLGIVVCAHGTTLEDAHRFEHALREELGARGLTIDGLEIQSDP